MRYIALFSGPGNSNYPDCDSSAWVEMKAQTLDEAGLELRKLVQEKHVATGASLDSVFVVEVGNLHRYRLDLIWKNILKESERNKKLEKLRDLAGQIVQIQEEIDKLQQELRSE